MGVKVREKRGKLYLDVYWGGKRYWEALHLTLGPDKNANKEAWRLADIIRQKKELQLVSGDNDLLDPILGKKTLILYAEELAAKQNVKNPLPKSLRYLRNFAGNAQLNVINERWLERYQDFLRQQTELGPSTAAKYWGALVFVLRRAVRDRIIPRNPAEAIKGMSAPETVKVYLTPDEMARLASVPLGGELGGEVRRAFLFACLTGLRVSDIRSLTWGNITREPWQILKRQQKTQSVVGVPMNKSAVSIIDDNMIHHRDELVFPRLTKSKSNTNQYLVSWGMAAKVDKQIGWHTARHTFATLSLEGGADIATVSRLLGHTKLSTTMVYAKSTDDAKRRAVDALPDIRLES
jgi:integrase